MLGDVCRTISSQALHHTSGNVSSSFIQPFAELATEHLRLNSSWRDLDSLLASAKTIKGLHFVPSPFLVKQTDTQTLSCPVDLGEHFMLLLIPLWCLTPYHSTREFHRSLGYLKVQMNFAFAIGEHP